MQYLLHLLGVQSTVVTGTAGGEAHAWNLVRMDGNYYYVDTTLGNSTYSDDSGIAHRYVNYNYFGITTEELLKTHIPKDYYELPECTSIENNFYVKEGLYVTEWAPSIIGGICKAAYEREHSLASVKFSTRELYEQAKTYFIKGNHIADYCDIEKLQYIANYRQYILTFKLK